MSNAQTLQCAETESGTPPDMEFVGARGFGIAPVAEASLGTTVRATDACSRVSRTDSGMSLAYLAPLRASSH